MAATSSTAARNESSFDFDGLLKPLIFRTNWSEAARISSGVTGGSKLKRILIFLHIHNYLELSESPKGERMSVLVVHASMLNRLTLIVTGAVTLEIGIRRSRGGLSSNLGC